MQTQARHTGNSKAYATYSLQAKQHLCTLLHVSCIQSWAHYKRSWLAQPNNPGCPFAPPCGAGEASSSVYDAVSAAMTTGIGQHLPGSSSGLDGPAGGGSNPSWRPRGVLASHLMEHRAAVNCLATSNNGALLLSGSDDETVKVIREPGSVGHSSDFSTIAGALFEKSSQKSIAALTLVVSPSG